MFDTSFIRNAIVRSSETALDRRRFFEATGIAGLGIGAAALAAPSASAEEVAADGPSDGSILNFALNLEYLEAEFYLRAVTGAGLSSGDINGVGSTGGVVGGKAVPFKTPWLKSFAAEVANDEKAHVKFLRSQLGGTAVARPAINLSASFTAAATAAGLIQAGQSFDPFLNEQNFLLGAFVFEDVGVTAYKGAAPFIQNKTYLEAAAGILAVEAYHAGTIRSALYAAGLDVQAGKLSDARDSLDGPSDDDQGIKVNGQANIQPTDANGIAFSRSPGQVLNVVYLNSKAVTSGGFFPQGVHGDITTSQAN
ncbi:MULTISPECIES: ferritin-like domain-containing protein [unclassified Rathayibacter]|uniref:ferritin-like domain-containing protein n=1 Tax=unclassified Rathayibacter TaxID=2609250 RepID=UPI00188BBC3F|nr:MULTISPECIES: ferritin-like domain-containing protein [unclassified Rathayibacter]MBF4461441.1 ferritin-like domain-containing protein [Rathayibacter sp. VKM Ac-2879]MBF4502852.1 ferritin-like domain-containing protein [Rathayibacter sp. VKM Ac-2878]